jgi:hypothetical protein
MAETRCVNEPFERMGDLKLPDARANQDNPKDSLSSFLSSSSRSERVTCTPDCFIFSPAFFQIVAGVVEKLLDANPPSFR